MAFVDPSPILGLHLNFFPVFPSPGHMALDALRVQLFDDAHSKARARAASDVGAALQHTGYAHVQSTMPETLGVALADSPAG